MRWPSETMHDFRQKPRPALDLINPNLDETRGRHVLVFIASFVRRLKITGQLKMIGFGLSRHFLRADAFIVIAVPRLMP
jgi:hypothetical protein